MAYKVLQFIHALTTGGAERVVHDYCLYNEDPSVEMAVLCYERTGTTYESELINKDIRILFCEDYHSRNIVCSFIREFPLRPIRKAYAFLERMLTVRKLIRREHPDVLHGHLITSMYVLFANPSKDTRLFYTMHNEPEQNWKLNTVKGIVDYFSAFILSKFRGMEIFALNSKQLRKASRIFPGTSISLLPNGIDMSVKALKKSSDTKRGLGIPKDAFLVGYVGRFNLQKNHKFIIDIFERILSIKTNAYLLLAGDGEERENITAYAEEKGILDRVRMPGFRNDVPDLMACMDVLLFPSLWEGFPITLLEAQNAGLPCLVSTRVMRLDIASCRIRWLSLKRSPEEWARAAVLESKDRRDIIGLEDYDISNIIRKIIRKYTAKN